MNAEDTPMVSAEFHPGEGVRVDPRGWEEQARTVRDELAADGLGDDLLEEAIKELRFRDVDGTYWAYDGWRWWRWADPDWVEGTPTGPLRPEPFTMEVVLAEPPETGGDDDGEMDDIDDDADGDTDDEPEPYDPTNLIPPDGMPAWSEPDPERSPDATLEPDLDVMAIEWREDGWTQVRFSNGWTTWVDGRLLLPPDGV